jgi:ABC-type glycerol-3-phosphate transport system substrate-binding protein
MIEIEFSYIYDVDGDDLIWEPLIAEFCEQEKVEVKLRRMEWDNAWAQLFSFTSAAQNTPHVSHIGNTWVSSLARMNTLRPFKPSEISEIGEAGGFMNPNWQTGLQYGDKRVWAVPWTAWIYVMVYRKDLLRQVGIEPDGAFGTLKTAAGTIKRLAASGLEMPWLNPQAEVPGRDLLHMASSWIWAASGDIMDPDGSRVLFNSPETIEGLKVWLETFRAVPAAHRNYSREEVLELFGAGRAAAALCNIRAANTILNSTQHPEVRDNLGIASVTESPWTGGGSFVVWDNLHGYYEHERAVINLVKFLSSKSVQLRYSRAANDMPSRLDALDELYPDGNPAREAVMRAAQMGRGYYNMPIWRRVEAQLSEEMAQSVRDALTEPQGDLSEILHRRLDTLAGRLNITLEN